MREHLFEEKVSERGREVIDRAIETGWKIELGEGVGKVVDRLVESERKGEKCEGGRKIVNRLVENKDRQRMEKEGKRR